MSNLKSNPSRWHFVPFQVHMLDILMYGSCFWVTFTCIIVIDKYRYNTIPDTLADDDNGDGSDTIADGFVDFKLSDFFLLKFLCCFGCGCFECVLISLGSSFRWLFFAVTLFIFLDRSGSIPWWALYTWCANTLRTGLMEFTVALALAPAFAFTFAFGIAGAATVTSGQPTTWWT